MQLENMFDIIPHLYEKFSKADMALLCKDIASCKYKSPTMLKYQYMIIVKLSGGKLGKHDGRSSIQYTVGMYAY